MVTKVEKSVKVTIDNTHDVFILRELVVLGLQRLEEVDKPSWGKEYEEHKRWGQGFLDQTSLGR